MPLGCFDKGKERWYRVNKSLVMCMHYVGFRNPDLPASVMYMIHVSLSGLPSGM